MRASKADSIDFDSQNIEQNYLEDYVNDEQILQQTDEFAQELAQPDDEPQTCVDNKLTLLNDIDNMLL